MTPSSQSPGRGPFCSGGHWCGGFCVGEGGHGCGASHPAAGVDGQGVAVPEPGCWGNGPDLDLGLVRLQPPPDFTCFKHFYILKWLEKIPRMWISHLRILSVVSWQHGPGRLRPAHGCLAARRKHSRPEQGRQAPSPPQPSPP